MPERPPSSFKSELGRVRAELTAIELEVGKLCSADEEFLAVGRRPIGPKRFGRQFKPLRQLRFGTAPTSCMIL
jgi:hypothetical protein